MTMHQQAAIAPAELPQSRVISGAEAILTCLLEEGVDTIFGYPGGAIMPVYDALYHFQDRLRHVLPRHEQGAIHAAEGYARVTRRTIPPRWFALPARYSAICWGRMPFRKPMWSTVPFRSPSGIIKSPRRLKYRKYLRKHFTSPIQDAPGPLSLMSPKMHR